MNITKIDTDATKAVLKILISKEDYEPNIQKSLKEYQRKIELKGFRKGMVPIGIVKKMYGKTMLIEEINKRKNFDYYSFIVRDESSKEHISYEWLLIPINYLILDPSSYVWEPTIGKRGKNKGWHLHT